MNRGVEASAAGATTASSPIDWVRDTAWLVGGGDRLGGTGAELKRRATALAARLRERFPAGSTVGMLADNSADWIAVDLALQAAGIAHVPLPAFFSGEQLAHAIRASSLSGLFCQDATRAARLGFRIEAFAAGALGCFAAADPCAIPSAAALPGEVAKITFTSGTTGTPKGVMLSAEQQLRTARSLAAATEHLGISRHLCLLPLPVLLENVAGAYTALMTGATCICPSLDAAGMHGSSRFDPRRCLETIAAARADSIILLPQMLQAITGVLEADDSARRAVAGLKFAAVGGAPTPARLIERARALGLPVYEGYGLSECASVVSVNVPGMDRPGTVGRALPGVQVRLARGGEIEVRAYPFKGYLGAAPPAPDAWFATGDLGTLDTEGYLRLAGRKKHMLVTSFGRNVSPEWPEALLAERPGILQAVVLGDARPFLTAVVVAAPALSDAAIREHVAATNARLPDYARIGAWIRAIEPFTAANGLSTANGRTRRDVVLEHYAGAIGAIYREASEPCQPSAPRVPPHPTRTP